MAKLQTCFLAGILASSAGLLLPAAARADSIVSYLVSLDTAPLLPPSGTYVLDFRFYDGSFSNDTNNSFAASQFNVGPSGAGVIATDAFPFNDRTFDFIPASLLSFRLSVTTSLDTGPLPDDLKVTLFNPNGYALPTTDSVTSALFDIYIDGNPPAVKIYQPVASDPATGTTNPLTSAANVAAPLEIPETGSFGLVTLGLIAAGLYWFRTRCRKTRWRGATAGWAVADSYPAQTNCLQ
ncbi:MAG: hypothetical protein ACRD9L_27990 [Bryobacteraceae bacterium]